MTTAHRPRLTPAQKALVRSDAAEQLVDWVRRVYAPRFPEAEPDDIVALAREALVLAAVRFDPGRGVRFATYASHRVRGHLLRQLSSARYRKAPIEALLAESERQKETRAADDMDAASLTPEQSRQATRAWTDARCWELAIATMLHPVVTATPEEVAAWQQARLALEEGR
ncbi:MAG: sigma factor, partial [Polyangiaceae bacterium]